MTHLFMYAIVPILLVLICSIPAAAAHTTVSVDQYDIEVGWGIEPPIVGLRNDFVIHISEPGDVKGVSSGVKNAFRNICRGRCNTYTFGSESNLSIILKLSQ